MKPYFIIFLIVLSSCEKNSKKVSSDSIEPITVYNQATYNELWKANKDLKVNVIDTACLNQRKRAELDIDNGKLYYFHSKALYEWKEMAELLSEYNIEYRNHDYSDIDPHPGFENYCYQKVMWSEINKTIGKKTIDSLWIIAEQNFVLKYPDSLYIKDGIDVRLKYQIN